MEKLSDKYIPTPGGRIKHLEYFKGTEYLPGNTTIIDGYTGPETVRTSFITPAISRIKIEDVSIRNE